MMKRTISAMLAAALFAAGAQTSYAQSQSFSTGQWIQVQNAILKELGRHYVDSLPVVNMRDAAISAMLAELDPYTVYVPEEAREDFRLMVGKTYGGIGAVIYKPEKDGNVIINEPYEGSPAVEAGLKCCDEILSIDGVSARGLETKEASDRMKGQPGTVVHFVVKKAHSGDTVGVDVTRRRIHLPDIEYYGMLDGGIGYVFQSGFTEGVADSLRAAILDLKAQGMKTLVYDLRGNGGGLMHEAVRIASLFLPEGTVVVSSRGRTGEGDTYRTYGQPVDTGLPIYILVDGGSASASEIVTGALQDHGRATVMGRRTFGKGLVQSIVDLPYGGQLKVTTARYYTPSGRCVQAIDYGSGKKAEDGGGLMPDVELASVKWPEAVYDVIMRGYVEQYVLDYVRGHESIPDEFPLDGTAGFLDYVAPKLDAAQADSLRAAPKDLLDTYIEKEIVVRYRFQRAGVRAGISHDPQLQEALSHIRG